jgi:hypothetical protein
LYFVCIRSRAGASNLSCRKPPGHPKYIISSFDFVTFFSHSHSHFQPKPHCSHWQSRLGFPCSCLSRPCTTFFRPVDLGSASCPRVLFGRAACGLILDQFSRWMILVNALTIIANTRRNTLVNKEESARISYSSSRELSPRFQFRFPSDALLDPNFGLSNGNGTKYGVHATDPRLERLGLCIDLCSHLHHHYGGIIIGLDCQQIGYVRTTTYLPLTRSFCCNHLSFNLWGTHTIGLQKLYVRTVTSRHSHFTIETLSNYQLLVPAPIHRRLQMPFSNLPLAWTGLLGRQPRPETQSKPDPTPLPIIPWRL